ncbi:MAG: sortase [Chloroflexi bacterium]|nr:sortase [Chloroflexota bacterium]
MFNGRKRTGNLLILIGALFLLAAAMSLLLSQAGERQGAGQAGPSSGVGQVISPLVVSTAPPPTLLLGPTAAAAATWLPPPTPIATAGPLAQRASAPQRIVIPRVALDAPVVPVGWQVIQAGNEVYGRWHTVADAVGHHRGSADPGQLGNCVLSAHSSDAGGALFRRLDELVSGDAVELYTVDGQRHTYIVQTLVTLDESGATAAEKREHARWLDSTDEPMLTLVTCWPAWSYTHRLIVRARLWEE